MSNPRSFSRELNTSGNDAAVAKISREPIRSARGAVRIIGMHFSRFVAAAALTFLSVGLSGAQTPADRGRAERVVVVVWDGMRPDLVTEKNAPTLTALARDGVFFRNNHAAYPTSTNVNGTVLATGDYPGHSGIIANQEYRPGIDPLKPFDTSDLAALDAPDQQINSKYIAAPTVAETLQKAGDRTAVAGSKPVAQLADRARNRTGAAAESVDLHRGKTLPTAALAEIKTALGPFPEKKDTFPNSAVDAWTTRALTEVLWKKEVPKFSLLWLSEPDLTQHHTAPGAPAALAAIKSSDDNLARVLAALRAKNALATTDVFVVSDHGFSTIDLAVDVAERLRAAGFDAVRAFKSAPKTGQVLVVSLGGSVEFYVIGHDETVAKKLVDFLQRSDFAGVILTRGKMEGTFTLADAHIASAAAPDIVVALRWNDRPNEFGIPGEIASDTSSKGLGHGTHSTLSPRDLHNTLIAAGPDFRRGFAGETPTGNIDVAPTVLWLLGIKPLQPMDGRVLREALTSSSPTPRVARKTLTASRNLGGTTWRQTLRLTTVNGVTYFMEGVGGRK